MTEPALLALWEDLCRLVGEALHLEISCGDADLDAADREHVVAAIAAVVAQLKRFDVPECQEGCEAILTQAADRQWVTQYTSFYQQSFALLNRIPSVLASRRNARIQASTEGQVHGRFTRVSADQVINAGMLYGEAQRDRGLSLTRTRYAWDFLGSVRRDPSRRSQADIATAKERWMFADTEQRDSQRRLKQWGAVLEQAIDDLGLRKTAGREPFTDCAESWTEEDGFTAHSWAQMLVARAWLSKRGDDLPKVLEDLMSALRSVREKELAALTAIDAVQAGAERDAVRQIVRSTTPTASWLAAFHDVGVEVGLLHHLIAGWDAHCELVSDEESLTQALMRVSEVLKKIYEPAVAQRLATLEQPINPSTATSIDSGALGDFIRFAAGRLHDLEHIRARCAPAVWDVEPRQKSYERVLDLNRRAEALGLPFGPGDGQPEDWLTFAQEFARFARLLETAKRRKTERALSVSVPSASVAGPPVAREALAATHSKDFTSVNWYGTQYTFTLGIQASAVRELWAEWERSGLHLHQDTIGNAIDAERENFRLDKTFRNHPALGTMIRGIGGGLYQLAPPEGEMGSGPPGKNPRGIPADARQKPA